MKKSILILLLFAGITAANAQKTVPVIKAGTNIYMTVMAGQEVPVVVTVEKMDGPVSLKWAVDGYGEGTFEMTAAGVEKGDKWFTGQPAPGATPLGDSETFSIISKAAFKSLVDTKSFTYSGIKFTLKEGSPALKLGGKEMDAFHAVAEDGKTELWVLNNPALPLLLQTSGIGMDINVNEIK